MRIANDTLIPNGPQAMVGAFSLEPVWLGHIVNYAIQLVWTGVPEGTLKLQASNDKGRQDKTNGGWDTSTIVNWTDVQDSDQDISGAAGNHVWNVENCGYLWVRVVWTPTAGTGSLTVANMNAKGI